MRLIALLLVVLAIGYLVYKQTNPESNELVLDDQDTTHLNVPKISTNPNELKTFKKDINEFVMDEAAKTRAQIEAAETQ